jgi:hypothetical protein
MASFFFESDTLDNYLGQIRDRAVEAVARFPEDAITVRGDEEISVELVERFQVEMVELLRDAGELTSKEVQIDVSGDPLRYFSRERSGPFYVKGEQWTLHVPFTGEAKLFGLRPSTHLLTRFPGSVRDGELRVWFEFPDGREVDVEAELLGQIGKIEQELAHARNDIELFNAHLPQEIAGALARRRAEIARHNERLGKLTIPVRRGPEPETRPARTVQRRAARPARGAGSRRAPSAESRATLTAEYEHILEILRTYGRQMERAPASFAMSEEGRRDAMLGALATHYRGQAFAEAFNRRGKTDILLREDNHNLFISECKIWKGSKAFSEALDQLLGYATWHDTRLSLIVFVEQRDLSRVIAGTRKALDQHEAFGGWRAGGSETELRCELKFPGDDAQRLQLAVLFVHLVP